MVRAIVLSIIVLLVAGACSTARKGATTQPSSSVEPTVTAESTLAPSATPTTAPEPTAVPPTPTPEPIVEPPSANPVPGSCAVFEEKYCALGEIVEWGGYRALAFDIPAGAAIFAPFTATLNTTGTSLISPQAKVMSLLLNQGEPVADPEDVTFSIIGDLDFIRTGQQLQGGDLVATDPQVQKGELLARTADSGITVFGHYRVFLWFGRYSVDKKIFVPDPVVFQPFFPYYQ